MGNVAQLKHSNLRVGRKGQSDQLPTALAGSSRLREWRVSGAGPRRRSTVLFQCLTPRECTPTHAERRTWRCGQRG